MCATTRPCTSVAPAARNARAAAASVAPVVTTSSINSSRDDALRVATKAGPRAGPPTVARSARGRRLVGASADTADPTRSATARASSSAWSKPRARRRAADVGAHVTTSTSWVDNRANASASRCDRATPVAILERGHQLACGALVGEQRRAGGETRRRRHRRPPAGGSVHTWDTAKRPATSHTAHRVGNSHSNTAEPYGRRVTPSSVT